MTTNEKPNLAFDSNVNRNSSFINTASKLLEKAKQQHFNQYEEPRQAKIVYRAKHTIVQPETNQKPSLIIQ